MGNYLPIKFQLDDEQHEASDFIEFQGTVFNAGGTTLTAPADKPRCYLLLEFTGSGGPEALTMLGEDYTGFAWTIDDQYRAVVRLDRDANPDECLTHSQAVQKELRRYFDVTFNETTALPAPTKDIAVHPLNGKPLAASGMLSSVSAYDMKNVDRRALAAFVDKLKDHDLWTLQRGYFPLGAEQTPRGHDEALARILHRHGAKPEWIANLVAANNQHGLEERHNDMDYLNEVIRATCTADVADEAKFDAPYMSELWDEDPATKWLIQDVLEDGVIAEIWGASGTLKTFIAVDMAVAVASGEHYHGEEVRRTGPVLIIPGEGRRGLKKRIRVLCQKRGLGRDIKVRVANRPVMMAKADQAEWLRDQIAKFEDATPVLLILDTLARNFGGNENSTEDMNGFIDNAAMLTQAFGVPITILIIHHCGHDTTHSRGAYAFHAGIDNEYKTEVDPKSGTIKLINIKMKDTDLREPFYFQRQVIQLLDKDNNVMRDNGKPIDSLVLVVGDVQREAERDAFFKDHPEFKNGKRAERLRDILRYARCNPEAVNNEVAGVVAPKTKNRTWIKDVRKSMLAAELIQGDHFQLTDAGLNALRILDDYTNLALSGKAPEVKGGVREDLL